MFKVSEAFNKEINKLQGRKFNAKVIIRDKEYSGNQIYEMNLEESVNPSDSFSIGSICSNSFDIKLINTGDIFDNAIVKPYVGLYIGDDIEYIPLGVFNVIKTSVKGKFINLECVDNMLGLEKVYFSDLSYPADINDIAKEICKKAGVNLASKLPNYRVNKIEGYSLREAIGFIASLCGSFARFNRIGDLEIRDYEVVKQEMTPHNLFKLDIEANECIIKKVIAKKGEEELSTGTDDGNKIVFNNPIITKEILSDIYTKYNGFKYIPYTAKWKGNPAIMAGDILNLTDLNGNKYNALIMEQKFTYKNGISSEVKAKGKTRQDSSFDSKGSVTQSMERYSIEQANIKKALIDKASINDLTAVDAKIQRLYTEDLTAIRADIVTLNSQKANIIELNSVRADLQQAIIGKANITDLNAAVGKINVLESKTGNIENLLAGNLTANNFKANSITANSGIIAEGAIGSAQISSLSVNKLEAGEFITSKHKIVSADGTIEIVGNQILINRNNVNRVILGEYRKQDNTTEYGLLIRGKDGKTIMLDSDGVHNAGITNGAIDNNKVADNANISGNKLDINSVIREVNNNGTETIKGTKVTVGDRTLDVELSTQNNTITEHSKELSSQKASLTALDNALKFKVDSQTFTQSTTTINNNINRAKQEAINSSNSHADSKANEALNNAKAFVNSEITNVNTHLNKNTSEINILKDQIESKVSQTDIDKSIKNIKFGGRNLFPKKYISGHGCSIKLTDSYNKIPTYLVQVTHPNQGNNFGINLNTPIKFNGYGIDFTISFFYKIIKFVGNLNISGYIKVQYEDNSTESFSFDKLIKDCREKENWNTWEKIDFNFKTKKDKNIISIINFYFYCDLAQEGSSMLVTAPKLEEGTKSTDYTPAIEDTDQLIIDNIKTVTDKISTVESKLTQENNSIKASVQDLNSTTQSITTNVSNINRDLTSKINSNLDAAKNFATDIAIAKANLAKEQAIASADGKITTEEQKRIQQAQENLNTAIARADKAKQDAINVASTDATNKANNALNSAKTYVNAEITTVNNKVHNVESNLNILSNEIKSKVSQSDIDKSINEIKIGGRNLIVNSDILQNLFYPLSEYSGTREVIKDDYALCKKDVVFKCTNAGTGFHLPLFTKNSNRIGKTYTWSFWAKCSVNKRGTIGHESNGQTQVEFTTEWKKFSHTWLFGDCTYSSFTFYIGWNVGEVLYIRDFKIEEGTKATDWTAAPEDTNQLIVDSIKVIDTKISDVSSSVTQLRDSVTTDIRAINSKTQSIETTLNGKASKQEVTEVNNRVATIKASLDGITQRVSATESKAQTLESNINDKASKQEVVNINSRVTNVETNLNGITNRVSATESRINTLDGRVASAVTIQQFTEYKQSNRDFQLRVAQTTNLHNLVPNGTFAGGLREWICGGEFWSGPYTGYGFSGKVCGAVKNKSTSEKFLTSYKSFKVEKNTTYTLNFHYKVEQNIQSMEAFVMLSNTESGDYGQVIRVMQALGGERSDLSNDIPYSFTFNTGNFEWVWLRFDNNGMKPNTNLDEYCWLYISEVAVYKGNVGAVKYLPKGGETYDTIFKLDGMGYNCKFASGAWNQIGEEGNMWYAPGMKYPYRSLSYHEAVSINTDGSNNYIYRDVQLPARFDYVDPQYIDITASLKGWYKYTGKPFSSENITVSTGRVYRANGHTYAQVACRGCIRDNDTFTTEGLQVVATLHVTA
ncbi:hypothetical protein ACV3R5_05995 [Clostridium perfringens]